MLGENSKKTALAANPHAGLLFRQSPPPPPHILLVFQVVI